MEEEVQSYADEELSTYFSVDIEKMYIQEILQYPLLSKEEERELTIRYKNGDLEARDRLIKCNLRLVLYVLRKMRCKRIHGKFLDLIQYGNIGLIRAVESFNPDISSFSTYAWDWIRKYIISGAKKEGNAIKFSIRKLTLINKFKNILMECYRENRPMYTDKELCEMLGIDLGTLKTVEECANWSFQPISVNDKDEEEKIEANIADLDSEIYYEQSEDNIDTHDLLAVLKEVLSDFEYYILYQHVLSQENHSLEDIAQTLGITKPRVWQIEGEVLERVKKYLQNDGILYLKTRNFIKRRERHRYERLYLAPINPNDIAKYYYIKDDLSFLEQTVLKRILFPKYHLDDVTEALELGLSTKEYRSIKDALEKKFDEKFKNIEHYFQFRADFIKKHKRQMFDLVANEEFNPNGYGKNALTMVKQ